MKSSIVIAAFSAAMALTACQTSSGPVTVTGPTTSAATTTVQYDSLALLDIPANTQLVRNPSLFASSFSNSAYSVSSRAQTQMGYYVDMADCKTVITTFDIRNTPESHKHYHECMVNMANQVNAYNFNYVDDIGEIILYHATNRNVYPRGNNGNVDSTEYQTYNTIGFEGFFYAMFRNWIEYTPEQRATVESWFVEQFTRYNFPAQEGRTRCSVTDPASNASNPRIGVNACGTYAHQMVTGELAFAIATNNEALFDKAGRDVDYLLGTYDNEGIHVMHASRGGLALGYHKDITVYLGMLTELYYAVGYDFLEHRMPRSGITVKQVFDKHWEILYDRHILDKYARYNKGVNYSFEELGDATTEQNIAQEGFRRSHVARANHRYIMRYRNDLRPLLNDNANLAQSYFASWVPVEILYLSNR